MKKFLCVAGLFLAAGASLANAAVTPCLGASISNVVGQSFTCFGLTYSAFSVSTNNPSSGVTVGVDAANTGRDTTTGNVDIAFQFSGIINPSSVDIQLAYFVLGGTIGVDWQLTNTNAGGAITLGEFICPFSSGGTNAGGCNSGQ